MKYRAKTDGFVDSHYVCEGDVFEYDGPVPSWAIPLEEPKPEPVKPEKTEEAATPPPAPKKKSTKK